MYIMYINLSQSEQNLYGSVSPSLIPMCFPQDGSRREVNLIPNAQIEDQLFNQLADKKVDVVPWTSLGI